jgi:hypothetical protein
MSVPLVQRPFLPQSTIVPDTDDLQTFMQYLTRLYEDIAFAVNNRDFIFFTMAITNKPTTIPNLPLFGSFLILISGQTPGLPCVSTIINKADIFQKGLTYELSQQDGNVAPWSTIGLMIVNNVSPPSTGEITIQVLHDGPSTLIGNFNVRIMGTQ